MCPNVRYPGTARFPGFFCTLRKELFLIAIVTHKELPIFISILQILGLVFTILLYKGIIKKQNNWLKYVVLIATVLLAVLNVMSYSFENKPEYNKTDNNILKKEIKVTTIQIPVGKEELAILYV